MRNHSNLVISDSAGLRVCESFSGAIRRLGAWQLEPFILAQGERGDILVASDEESVDRIPIG